MTLRPDDPTVMFSGDAAGPDLPSGPSLVDQKIVEAAIRRGLISAVQATSVLESLSGTPPGGNPLPASSSTGSSPALQDLIARGLVSTAVAAELEEEVKNDFVPGYTLEGELGRGGMGVVYRARQRRLDRAVALKVVNPGAAHEPDYLRRFKQEALALAKLNHPHIVQVYDYGETAGKVYLALELVEGHDAMAALKDGAMSEAQALRVVRDAALGLGHAHAAGVIHRDVKPHNLMLVAKARPGPDDRWVAKVTDLGLARQATRGADEAQSTKEGVILGSPAYMSPEQADGQPADFRSDIYALGATLYHLVTGTPPYQAESAIKVIVKKQTERLDDPRALAPRLTEATVRVLDRCMARPRDDRYPTYEALVEDLERVLRGEAPLTPVVPEHASSLRLAPARPGTARLLPPPAGAARPSEARGGSGMIAAAVIAGVVIVSGAISIALAVHRHPGAFGDDPAPSTDVAAPSPAARVGAALDALAGLSPGDVLAPARLRGVREQVEALPEADRPPLALQLASVVGKALDATAEARVAALEATLARGDYARLAAAVDDAVAPYRLIEREVPARLRELQDLARQAAGPEGEAERAAWAAARAVSDPLAVIAALEGFEARFPWSPALGEARARLAEAAARAPEVTLVAEPPDARVVLDGKPLPPGGWTGRLLAGRHEVSAEAPGHYVLERTLDVQAPGTITLRLNPQPARPLVEDKEREYPAWIPSRPLLEQWTLESGHFVAAPEVSALRGEGREGGGWSIATRDLAPSLKRVRAPTTGPWRLVWHVVAPSNEGGGAAELRLLAGPDGRTAVVGAGDGAVYLGLRGPGGEPLEVLARQPLGELAQGAAVLAADWDGAVLVVYQRGDLVGSAVLPWEAAAPRVQVAVQGSTAEFRSMLVRPLIESGAR